MDRMKDFPSLLATMLVTMFFCVACGEKSVVDAVEKMYDDGIARVQKAEGVNDVQQIYDEVTKQVKDFKNEHLKEFASLDSTASSLQKAEETFIKACCMKSEEYDCGIQTDKGRARLDDSGNVFIYNGQVDEENDVQKATSYNPLNIIDYTYVTEVIDNMTYCYITVQTPNGDYLYDEEDAERYYDFYFPQFFFAYVIGEKIAWYNSSISDIKKSTIDYVKKNLFDIVNHLPLDNSYPNDVVKYVNKIYYDNKEEAATVYSSKRDYGFSEYGYYKNNNRYDQNHFRLRRIHDDKFVIMVRSI